MPPLHKSIPLPKIVIAAGWAALFSAVMRELLGSYEMVSIGAFQLSALDPAIVLSIAAICMLLKRSRMKFTLPSILLVGFATVVLIKIARGIPAHGLDAVIALRAAAPLPGFLILAALLSRRIYDYRPVINAVVRTGVALAGLTLVRLLFGPETLFFGEVGSSFEINDGGRSLSSQGTALIGFTLLFFCHLYANSLTRRSRRRHAGMAAALLPVVVLTYQATAVAAVMSGIAIFLVAAPGQTKIARRVTVAAAVTLGAGALVILVDLGAQELVLGDVSQRLTNLTTRHLVWDALMEDYRRWSLIDQVIGLPAGEAYQLTVMFGSQWREWQLSVHSMYYGSLAAFGAVGLILYIGILSNISYRCIARLRGGSDSQVGPALGLSFCAVIAILGYSYEIRGPDQGLILGLALIAAIESGRRPTLLTAPVRSVQILPPSNVDRQRPRIRESYIGGE